MSLAHVEAAPVRPRRSLHALVGISHLARMTGVTPRALRHYEDAGLIQPSRDAAGVRQFTPDQCEQVALIVRLRRCDVSLETIREVLAAAPHDRQARLQGVLRDKARELSRTLEVVTLTLAEAA